MDLTEAIIAKSDQLNADDLLAGPRTFTITEVKRGDAEQPVAIVLKEFPAKRPFKPSKTVVRILVHAFGSETDDWPPGVRMTLYRDASVKWAGQEIGGIRVSHLSHIDKPLKVALAEAKGKKHLHRPRHHRPPVRRPHPGSEPAVTRRQSPRALLSTWHTTTTAALHTDRPWWGTRGLAGVGAVVVEGWVMGA